MSQRDDGAAKHKAERLHERRVIRCENKFMPCLLAILITAFPRIAIILLYLLTNFFHGVYQSVLLPILGFLFLPLTLLVYTYLLRSHTPMGTMQFVIIFVAVILDLGLLGAARRRSS